MIYRVSKNGKILGRLATKDSNIIDASERFKYMIGRKFFALRNEAKEMDFSIEILSAETTLSGRHSKDKSPISLFEVA